MITVKLNPYTEQNVQTLRKYLTDAYDSLLKDRCDENCTYCEHKVICDDLFNVVGYLNQEIEQGYPHSKEHYYHPKKGRKH